MLMYFMKIRPVGTELFHAEGRTDMKLIVAFRNFANAPKKNPIASLRFHRNKGSVKTPHCYVILTLPVMF
jgi:hypothetical protein